MKDKANQRKKLQAKAYLSWKRHDYLEADEEVPKKLVKDEKHSEGQLMTDQEIVEWIVDTQKTFKIIKEKNKDIFNKLYQGFVLDLEYLVKIGKIDEDTADDLLNIDNFEF